MKKVIGYLIILVIVASFVMAGCSQPSPAPQSSTAAKPQTSATNNVLLKLGHDTAPSTWLGISADWFAKEFNKRAQGRVQIEVYPSSALAAQAKAVDYLRAGMADMYILSTGTHAKTFPLSVADSLPGIGFPTTVEGKAAALNTFMSIINKYPSAAAEWKEFKVVTYYGGCDIHLLTKDAEIHTPAQTKGVKVGCLGLRQDLMGLMGATPVMDIPPQAYEKLQTGITQATCVDWTAVLGFQLWEVAKYYLEVKLGGNGLPLVISKAAWDKVSASDQKLLLDVGAESQKAYLESLKQRETEGIQKFSAAAGRSVIKSTAAETTQWQQTYSLLWDKWVADQEAAGKTDARAILEEWKNASQKASGG